jgi:geranylgeranyl reductase family protein
VGARRLDVLVVGAGPAGSTAALVLARAGARVGLLDKARFPRDKACGDLIGPRGLQVLADLAVPEPPGLDVGDMLVVGPTDRRVVLPCFDGVAYPGRARAVTRSVFDDALRTAALDAGAEPVEGRADLPLWSDAGLDGFVVDGGVALHADFVIGADGATSHVAQVASLVEESRVLWGFAVRCYVDQHVDLPAIALWEQERWHAFPGYGWIFPGPDGGANLGIGVGTLADRRSGAAAVQRLPAFVEHLVRLGLLDRAAASPLPRRLGGWLKMGMVGTMPAAGRVLLVGDAAGLVNPLQGEGIAPAMTSACAAAGAILATPGSAAAHYRGALARSHLPYQRVAATGHAALVGRPRAVAAVGRVLTAPGFGRAVAGGWGIFWNELLVGAAPGRARRIAAASTWVGRAATRTSGVARWFRKLAQDAD